MIGRYALVGCILTSLTLCGCVTHGKYNAAVEAERQRTRLALKHTDKTQAKLKDVRTRLEQGDLELRATKANAARLEAELKIAQSKLNASRSEIKTAQAAAAAAERKNAEFSAELDKAAAKAAASGKQVAILQAKLTALQEKIEELTREIETMKAAPAEESAP